MRPEARLLLGAQKSGGTLPAGVINRVVLIIGAGQNDLGNGDKGIPLLEQTLNNTRQSLRGMEGGVVEEHDRAWLDLAGYPAGDLPGGEVFPVQTVHVPLNGFHTDGADGSDDVVVIFSIGRADKSRANTGDSFDLIVAGLHIGHDFLRGELGEMGVGVGVIHHLMSGIGQSLDRVGVFVHPVAHHKERGLHVILPQNVDELLGVFVPPGERKIAADGTFKVGSGIVPSGGIVWVTCQ